MAKCDLSGADTGPAGSSTDETELASVHRYRQGLRELQQRHAQGLADGADKGDAEIGAGGEESLADDHADKGKGGGKGGKAPKKKPV